MEHPGSPPGVGVDEHPVRDENVDLRYLRSIVEAGDERDPLHVLRFLERMRDVVGVDDAVLQIDAVAEKGSHLVVHADGRADPHRQVTGGRQLEDAAVDQDPVGGPTRDLLQDLGEVLLQAAQTARALGEQLQELWGRIGICLESLLDVGEVRRRCRQHIRLATARFVVRAGFRQVEEHLAKLALKLEDLRQIDVPGSHHHLPGPVATRQILHALAPGGPRIDEQSRGTRARQNAERDLAAAAVGGTETPDRFGQARGRDETAERRPLPGVVGRGDARAEMDLRYGDGLGLHQAESHGDGADDDPLDAKRTIGRRHTGLLTDLAVHLLLAAQSFGAAHGDQVDLGALDDGAAAGPGGLDDAVGELALAVGGSARHRLGSFAALDELGDIDGDCLRQEHRVAVGIDREAGADLQLIALGRQKIEAVHHSGASGLIRKSHELAQVLLLGRHVGGAQELAVVVVEASQGRRRRDHREAGLRRSGQQRLCRSVVSSRHGRTS